MCSKHIHSKPLIFPIFVEYSLLHMEHWLIYIKKDIKKTRIIKILTLIMFKHQMEAQLCVTYVTLKKEHVSKQIHSIPVSVEKPMLQM